MAVWTGKRINVSKLFWALFWVTALAGVAVMRVMGMLAVDRASAGH